MRIGGGLGYQTALVEVSLFPFQEKRWYAGGSSGTNTMKQYADKLGIRLENVDWLVKLGKFLPHLSMENLVIKSENI